MVRHWSAGWRIRSTRLGATGSPPTRRDWLERHVPYCALDDVRRLLAEPEQAVLVTTKEGEFAAQILEHWGIHLADIQGKEAGTHKCENLRALIADYTAAHGRRPRLWFVEDRLETLQTRHYPPRSRRRRPLSRRLGATTRPRCGRRCGMMDVFTCLTSSSFGPALAHGRKVAIVQKCSIRSDERLNPLG